jgi:outer membrane protein OmpA-like peptidoglycan-associated protein
LAAMESQLKGASNQEMALRETLSSKAKNFETKIKELEGKQNESQTALSAVRQQLKIEEADKALRLTAGAAEIEKLEGKYAGLRGAYITKQKEVDKLANELKTGADSFANLRENYTGTLSKAKQLSSELGDAKKVLQTKESELARTEQELAQTSDLLENAVTLAKRRQIVANNIMENFRKNGIEADVDSKTGDVTLDFGENYFADNSDKLRGEMENALRKAIPVYAKSLFGNDELASQIASVEIIGFASPTYGGKPINPRSLSSSDREAVNYNLDLSYRRARSIFDYIFDTDKLEFESQSTMLPLIEVTGRSFFSEDINPDDTGTLSIDEFCGQYNCSKSQRVIIKFGLLDKGEG